MPCPFRRSHSHLLPALAFALTAAPALTAQSHPAPLLPGPRLATLRAQVPASISKAKSALLNSRSVLGLGDGASFLAHNSFVNAQGRTVAHFHQIYEGHRVWGAEAIAYVEADGDIETLTSGLAKQVSIQGNPKLTTSQAIQTAMKDLKPKGPMPAQPKVELVAFPSHFTSGIATRFDSKKNAEVVDLGMSTWAKAPSESYVWAYEVKTLLSNNKDGHREMSYIVDADTGAILRKWNALQGDTPTSGSGQSYYRGSVNLSTAQAGDGTFALNALDKGTQPNPYVASQGGTQLGLTTYYAYADMNTGMLGFLPYAGHATNAWGNGTIYPSPWDYVNGMPIFDYSPDGSQAWLQGSLTPTGETAAVDAHFGLSTTWDFYKNVFNRDGVDGLGTSTFGIVHDLQYSFWSGAAPLQDNAQWSPWYFGMEFGDGTYPDLPFGMIAVTEMDITGHELSHGVTEYSAGLIYDGFSGAINEGNSDFFGKMVQAYADGGATGTTIPEFPTGDLTKWEVGHNSVPNGALRYMYKPSLDGLSADGWYDGIQMLNVHFSSGVVNRCLYFLSQGASSDSSNLTYSPYLPGGMMGLGNDTAARIWYKTLTEHLTPDADFDSARAGSIQSADELYGVGSPEETAVMNAWAAVNVGSAPGQPPRVRVSFPVINPPGSFLDTNAVPSGILAKVQIFPTRTTVQVRCDVTNTTNTKVDWSLATPAEGNQAGHINPDGTWTTPGWTFYEDLIPITARSEADQAQFAKGRVILVELDADTDNEIDAVDLGSVAMAWGLQQAPHQSASIAGGGFDDWNFVFFDQAFENAFPAN